MRNALLFLLLLFAGVAAAPVQAARFDASSPQCPPDGPLSSECGNIVFDGDSISVGAGASAGQGLDHQFMRGALLVARVANNAIGGRPVRDCLAAFDTNVAPSLAPRARFNLILFHAGDNDIARRLNAAETYAAFTQYVTKAHAQGWKVIVSSELYRFDFPAAQAAELDEYNRLLLGNAARADAVVDFSADARMTDPAARDDTQVFSKDRVHPSNGGYTILARMLIAAVPRLAFR